VATPYSRVETQRDKAIAAATPEDRGETAPQSGCESRIGRRIVQFPDGTRQLWQEFRIIEGRRSLT
jgi:hypothetical protein